MDGTCRGCRKLNIEHIIRGYPTAFLDWAVEEDCACGEMFSKFKSDNVDRFRVLRIAYATDINTKAAAGIVPPYCHRSAHRVLCNYGHQVVLFFHVHLLGVHRRR